MGDVSLDLLMREVAKLKAERDQQSNDKKGNGGHTGGQPPGGDALETRVAALEKAIPDIRERLARVETKLDGIESQMVTKADLSDLKAAMAESFHAQTKWFIGTAVVLAGLAFAAARFIPHLPSPG